MQLVDTPSHKCATPSDAPHPIHQSATPYYSKTITMNDLASVAKCLGPWFRLDAWDLCMRSPPPPALLVSPHDQSRCHPPGEMLLPTDMSSPTDVSAPTDLSSLHSPSDLPPPTDLSPPNLSPPASMLPFQHRCHNLWLVTPSPLTCHPPLTLSPTPHCQLPLASPRCTAMVAAKCLGLSGQISLWLFLWFWDKEKCSKNQWVALVSCSFLWFPAGLWLWIVILFLLAFVSASLCWGLREPTLCWRSFECQRGFWTLRRPIKPKKRSFPVYDQSARYTMVILMSSVDIPSQTAK